MQLGKRVRKAFAHRRYRTRGYLEAYGAHTDLRVLEDPHEAVGGLWDVLGPLQASYLIEHGLRPTHKMLDIGCGTLRGGRHVIRHLDAGRYTGMDISPEAIAYAERLAAAEGLTGKRPRLVVSTQRDLRFTEFPGEQFDYLLAQSVFTHLMAEHIDECFAHVGNVMHASSSFFFTFGESPEANQETRKHFRYPFSFFEQLAGRHGFAVELRTDYDHPHGQRMVRMTRR